MTELEFHDNYRRGCFRLCHMAKSRKKKLTCRNTKMLGDAGCTCLLKPTRIYWLNLFNAELSPKRYRQGGREIQGGGGRGRLYLTIHCHHQNDSCITVRTDDSHFNVSLIVGDKVTRQCPQTTTFEEKGEPKRNRTEVFLPTRLSNTSLLAYKDLLVHFKFECFTELRSCMKVELAVWAPRP